MTILFSYVLHIDIFCTTANMNPELPKLLIAPFKHPPIQLSFWFSLHRNRSFCDLCPAITLPVTERSIRQEKKRNLSLFCKSHDQTCLISQCIFALPHKALWAMLKSAIRNVQIWIILGPLPLQAAGDNALGHRGIQRRLLKHEIISAPETCRNKRPPWTDLCSVPTSFWGSRQEVSDFTWEVWAHPPACSNTGRQGEASQQFSSGAIIWTRL